MITNVLSGCQESQNRATWQSRLSVAYLQAVAAEACCSLSEVVPDVAKVDAVLTHEDVGIPIIVQLKSVVGPRFSGAGVPISIERKLY
ncbi:MAG TPA: hypothetical protein VK171_07695, partial [Fimbriimonas sp.]|nr:hypothetical protein [Fimbriimonas sp.]